MEADPERELVEQWFDENVKVDNEDDSSTGVPLDVLVKLPPSLGYAPLRTTEWDDFLKVFPSSGGRVSKENVVAGFLRVRDSLRRPAVVDVTAVEDSKVEVVATPPPTPQKVAIEEQRTLEMLRSQREVAEEASASMEHALDALKAELAAATKRSKALEARLDDKEAEAANLRHKMEETRTVKEQLERELALNKREAAGAIERTEQLKRETERLAKEVELAKAREAAAAQQKRAEKSRVDDVGAALQKTQEEILELMAEKGRLAELVEKLIQSNRRLEDAAREDQLEVKTLRQELEKVSVAGGAASRGAPDGGGEEAGSLAAELSTAVAEVKPAAAEQAEEKHMSAQDAVKLHNMVAQYANEYTKANEALGRVRLQLEQAMAALEEKARANQLLRESSLELTAQLKALERDRLALASKLRDRQRQVAMLQETIDNYANQPASFSFDEGRENRMAMSVAEAVASPGRPRRRNAWLLSLFSCCRPLASDETRYTRLL